MTMRCIEKLTPTHVRTTDTAPTQAQPGQRREQSANANLANVLRLLGVYVHSYDFVGLFEVKDVLTLGLVCRGLRGLFSKEFVRQVIRVGNLEPGLRYLFWINQAPYIKYVRHLKIVSRQGVVDGWHFLAFLTAATKDCSKKKLSYRSETSCAWPFASTPDPRGVVTFVGLMRPRSWLSPTSRPELRTSLRR